MVLGPDRGAPMAGEHGLDALCLLREDDGSTRVAGAGRLFSGQPSGIAPA
jgi:hypothetical protein